MSTDQQEARLITDSRHPFYTLNDIVKFRLTYIGGRQFIDEYLEQFDSREGTDDFARRKRLSHNPGFAAQALDEIIAGITQRMPEIIRKGGTESYNRAIEGLDGGVDLMNHSMNSFIGQQVLPEMTSMGRVGVYVDMPKFNPYSTLAELGGQPHPYLYWYKAEDILNWRQVFYNNELILTAVLLREQHPVPDPETGLPMEDKEVYRLIRLTPDGVVLQFYEQYVQDGKRKEQVIQEYRLPLKRIPFVLFDIGKSLLTDVADIQIGLLNLASADLSYAINSNFPFYVEGYDPRTESLATKKGPQTTFDADGNPVEKTQASADGTPEIVVGTVHGRRYPMEAPPPQFIHPSPDPLRASMEKQDRMKDDIRRLLNLNVSSISSSKNVYAKNMELASGLESGIASIGLELEGGERELAIIWAQYEGTDITSKLSIGYPRTYNLKTDEQRIKEAGELQAIQGSAPSRTYAKEVSKLIVQSILSGKVSQDTLASIFKEVDTAKYLTGDWQAIQSDFGLGIVDSETAATARGYDPSLVQKAQDERTKRMAEIAAAQSPGQGAALSAARGIKDGAPNAQLEKTNSQQADNNPEGTKSVRGKANVS